MPSEASKDGGEPGIQQELFVRPLRTPGDLTQLLR